MRKFLFALGAVILVLVIAGGVGLFFAARNGAALNAESKAYVDDAVVAITAHWSVDELMTRSTPQLRQITKPDVLRGLFDAASTALGPLVKYDGAKGEAVMSTRTGSGTTISARYFAHARFQKGDADFVVVLLKINGSWKIEGFHINSDALMRALTSHNG